MPPREVTCDLCGGKFFPRSLPHHRKTCEQKVQTQMLECPYCMMRVTLLEMDSHVLSCKAAKAAGAMPTGQSAQLRHRLEGRPGPPPQVNLPAGRSAPGKAAAQADAPSSATTAAAEAGLVPCAICGRTFSMDRVAKHQAICQKASKKRPVFNCQREYCEGDKVIGVGNDKATGVGNAQPSRLSSTTREPPENVLSRARPLKVKRQPSVPIREKAAPQGSVRPAAAATAKLAKPVPRAAWQEKSRALREAVRQARLQANPKASPKAPPLNFSDSKTSTGAMTTQPMSAAAPPLNRRDRPTSGPSSGPREHRHSITGTTGLSLASRSSGQRSTGTSFDDPSMGVQQLRAYNPPPRPLVTRAVLPSSNNVWSRQEVQNSSNIRGSQASSQTWQQAPIPLRQPMVSHIQRP
eukprot:gnl/TRDRNA2_/TRDRNA2_90475_c0_seq1.p1 gnl/TRDRNA2_/TRDRNA2_90475_c0~~gnl/TRDRNA2_/TRDRNA2_90475_c0_seq1.p1  ORF type:complete len:408 (+),score=56.85 gnl/TRDRNA2_/TRDRNA2_90475_c0_seq1:70-1293(+)